MACFGTAPEKRRFRGPSKSVAHGPDFAGTCLCRTSVSFNSQPGLLDPGWRLGICQIGVGSLSLNEKGRLVEWSRLQNRRSVHGLNNGVLRLAIS